MIAASLATVVRVASFVPTESVGETIPSVPLVDQNGRPFSIGGDGPETIVSFAYTRCPDPDMCSLVTTKFARLEQLLARTGIRLLEISLDPAYDRPAVLRRYADAVGARPPRWTFATGRPQDVFALARRFGIVFDPARTAARGHTELVAIVASDGTLVDRIDGASWSPNDVAAQAREDAGLSSNPFRRAALRAFASAGAICGGRGGGVTVIAAVALFLALTMAFAFITARLGTAKRPERSRS